MALMALACKHSAIMDSCLHLADNVNSYNGTSDLQLERMNVYFNEVRITATHLSDTANV
jgi:hypothetical protein